MPETIEAPVVTNPPENPEAAKPEDNKSEDFVYEYQPKDAEGRPLGAPQVIKAKNMQDALDKMANQNQELIRLNRKMKQDAALGLPSEELDKIPEDAERDIEEVDFTPKPLTAADRIQLARDMNDPDKIEQVAEKMSEILFGQKPDKVRSTLKRASTDIAATRAHAEATAFREAHPEFYNSMENIKVLVGMLQKEKLRPTKKNFELVYARAQKRDLLILAPPENVVETPAAEAQAENEPEPAQPKRTVSSSGLKKNSSAPSSGVGTRVKTYTKEEIKNMSAQEYREKVLNPQLRRQQAARQQ